MNKPFTGRLIIGRQYWVLDPPRPNSTVERWTKREYLGPDGQGRHRFKGDYYSRIVDGIVDSGYSNPILVGLEHIKPVKPEESAVALRARWRSKVASEFGPAIADCNPSESEFLDLLKARILLRRALPDASDTDKRLILFDYLTRDIRSCGADTG